MTNISRLRRRSLLMLVLPAVFILLTTRGSAQTPVGNPAPGPTIVISMEDAVRLAIEHNQALRAQRLNVDQAEAEEITAALKPNPVYTMSNEDFPFLSPKYLNFANLRDNQEYLHSISYTFERGGKRKKRMLVSQDNTEVASRTVEETERQLRFQVVQAFISVLLAKSNLQLAKDNLKDFSEVVEINRRRMEAGDISEADYLKISLQSLQFEQDVSAAQLALVQSKAGLRQLLGFDTIPENFNVSGNLEHKKHIVQLDELQRQALDSRPDFRTAQSGVKLAADTITLAQANRARDLSGEVEYKRNGIVNGFGFGISIELPIHDRNQGEIARSQHALRQARESAESTRVAVLTDVLNAYSNFRTGDQVLALYESGYLDQASQSREISNYAYRRGATSLLDLLDAERSYRETQFAFRQALADYMVSVEQINFVVGRQVIQ